MNALNTAVMLWSFAIGLAIGFFVGQLDATKRIVNEIKWGLLKR